MKRPCAVLAAVILVSTVARAEPRYVNVFHIQGPNWPGTSFVARATAPATIVRTSDCSGLSAYTANLAVAGAIAFNEKFTTSLCTQGVVLPDGTRIGVARLPLLAGDVDAKTVAVFEDAQHVVNVVEMPSVPEPLSGALDRKERYVFDEIEIGRDSIMSRARSTYVALLTEDGRAANVRFEFIGADGNPLLDASNRPVTESETVSGFAFHVITTPLRIGTAVMENVAIRVSPVVAPPRVFAIAFVGYGHGAPRAIAPHVQVEQ
jgi:hypothetical protein